MYISDNRQRSLRPTRWLARIGGALLLNALILFISACGESKKEAGAPTSAPAAEAKPESGKAAASATPDDNLPDEAVVDETAMNAHGMDLSALTRQMATPGPTPKPESRKKAFYSPPNVPAPPSVTVGTVSLGCVEHPFETGSSPLGYGQVGDYKLRNELITLIFRPVEPRGTWKQGEVDGDRIAHPGALLDVTAGGERADFIEEFTQGFGRDLAAPLVDYDTVEFLKREPADPAVRGGSAGLRLTGSVAGDDKTRVETTYWLAPGETKVQIVSRFVEGGEGLTISDAGRWGIGLVLADISGPAPQGETPEEREIGWYAARGGRLAAGIASFEGKLKGSFLKHQTRVEIPESKEGAKGGAAYTRWMFLGNGNFSNVTDQIVRQAGAKTPYGRLQGRILTRGSEKPDPAGWAAVFAYDKREGGGINRRLFTRARADAEGRYQIFLPAGKYFVAAGSRARQSAKPKTGLETSVQIIPGSIEERDLYVVPPATLQLRVLDAKTKKPIPARVRLTPLPPMPSGKLFEGISSARAFHDSFYVPREGTAVELWAGKWDLTITSGPRYDYTQSTIEMKWGSDTIIESELPPTVPTHGWLGVEFGVMTQSTEGSDLTPADVVLSAAGEGIDWVVSGDWERITDFAPAIKALGLEDRMGSSRGFRTWLPKHKEWGSFLIYPVAANAPAPETARENWKDLEDSKAFIETLRGLYPGSIIESITPFADGGGYFYQEGKNVYQMAWEARTDVDLGIDAVNLFEPRGLWNQRHQRDFFYVNTLRSRIYIPAPVSNRRVMLSAEPGYPRMLVRTDESDPTKVPEAKLFEAVRAGKWQITSGPFIEFTVDGHREGERFASGPTAKAHLKVTASNWVHANRIEFTKEGIAEWFELKPAEGGKSVRMDRDFEIKFLIKEKEGKDTAVGAGVQGSESIDPAVPAYGGQGIAPEAFTGPIYADTNQNKVWDPPSFRDKGK